VPESDSQWARSEASQPFEEVDLLALARRFEVGTCTGPATPLGQGHIHDTVLFGAGDSPRFVLQRINEYVFPDAEALVANLDRVTRHVREDLQRRGVEDLERRCLGITPTRDGESALRDDAGRLWRCAPFIEGTRSVDLVSDGTTGFAAARAFAEFIGQLADLPVDAVKDTIPHFHDLPRRVSLLKAAARDDSEGRSASVEADTTAILSAARRIAAALVEAGGASLPRRLVHNDCKINNLLFDADTDEPLCVVDLDTVMAGSALYDFGELVRTGASTASEDERDLPRVRFDLALFRPLVAGFVAGGRGAFTAEEIDAFAEAGPRMALENAVRFLADHLEGDRYFRVHRAGHNLDRARVQLRLLESMRDAETDVRAILAGLSGAAS
jgi:hypothetical protein